MQQHDNSPKTAHKLESKAADSAPSIPIARYTIGSVLLAGVAFFGLKLKPAEKDNYDSQNPFGHSSNVLPQLPRQSLANVKWQTTTVEDTGEDFTSKRYKKIQATEIDGSLAELQVAGSLIALKNHAANNGLDIRFLGHERLNGSYYVDLLAKTEEAQSWLKSNSESYGFFPAVNTEGSIIPGCYLHSPERISAVNLSAEILKSADFSSWMITFNAQHKTFAYELNNQGTNFILNHGLPVGAVPYAVTKTQNDADVYFKIDFKKAKDVIETLASCDCDSYQIVKVNKSIYTTLVNTYPELAPGSKEFQTLLKSSSALTNILFGYSAKKIPDDAYICIPKKNPQLKEPESLVAVKESGDKQNSTGTNYAVQGFADWNWSKNGNPSIAALALSASKNHPAKGGGNCGAGTCNVLTISPIAVLDLIANKNAKDPSGKPYYPGGARHAVYIAHHLDELSKQPGSGIIAVKISDIKDALPGSITCFPSSKGRFVLGEGKGSDKYGHIQIVSLEGGVVHYVYDLKTTKPDAGKVNNSIRSKELASKGELVCYVCTQSFLPSAEEAKSLAREFKIIGRESVEIVSQVLESGDQGLAAVSRMKNDPGGASYGKYQFSSKKGSLSEFIKFCLKNSQFAEIGNELKLAAGKEIKKVPLAFDATWQRISKNQTKLFEEAQDQFVKAHFTDRAIARAESFGIDVSSPGLKAFFNALAVQFGVPPKSLEHSPNTEKFDEICQTIMNSTPKGCDQNTLLSVALASRSGTLWRMGNYKIANGEVEAGQMYHSIVNNRYWQEAGLCYYLNIHSSTFTTSL